MYVWQLPEETQEAIMKDLKEALTELGFTGEQLEEEIQHGMNSKLNDLADTIDIKPYK